MFTVAGFGSLLSEKSARTTFPDLENFAVAQIRGYRRVFAHRAPIFYERGIANRETREESSLSCEPTGDPESTLTVTCFDVPWSEEAVAAFVEREHEFRFNGVPYMPLKGQGTLMGTLFGVGGISRPTPGMAVLCTRYSDEEYKSVRCRGDASEFERRYGRHGVTTIWDDPDIGSEEFILPCRTYLRHCVLASQKIGSAAKDSFLDDTYLADRTTKLRIYLSRNPTILFEQPPEELAERYGG